MRIIRVTRSWTNSSYDAGRGVRNEQDEPCVVSSTMRGSER